MNSVKAEAEIYEFETLEMGFARIARGCNRRLREGSLDARTRMEVELLQGIVSGDLDSADALCAKLEKMSAKGIRVAVDNSK